MRLVPAMQFTAQGTEDMGTQGSFTPVFKPTGPIKIWRGAGGGTLTLFQREGSSGVWRNTGRSFTVLGTRVLDAGFRGATEYTLVCTEYAGTPIDFEVTT